MRPTLTFGGVSFDWRLTFVIIVTTLLPMLDHYHSGPFGILGYDRFVWYFVIPALTIRLLLGQPLRDYGVQVGDWRAGLRWLLAALVVMALVLVVFVQFPGVRDYYAARSAGSFGRIVIQGGFEMFGWEFIWRGWLLFALARHIGPGAAIWLQAVPFALLHLEKPELETLTTVFGGAAFGWLAWRTRSFLYGWLIHWFMIVLTLLLVGGT